MDLCIIAEKRTWRDLERTWYVPVGGSSETHVWKLSSDDKHRHHTLTLLKKAKPGSDFVFYILMYNSTEYSLESHTVSICTITFVRIIYDILYTVYM